MQSGTPADANIHQVSKENKYQNVTFNDSLDPYIYDMETSTDPTRRLQDTNDATLENFFSRPLKIFQTGWGTGSVLAESINPWKLYWENPRVENRIANFNLLRANLHVKIVLNGNGFLYGRGIAFYLPYSAFDEMSTVTALISNDLVQSSQCPHVFLDPTTSTGGEMVLPMFNYVNAIHIPEAQWEDLGTLLIQGINTLKHANGADDTVTISVFAWAEDVSMSVLTSQQVPNMAAQSGLESIGDRFEVQSGEIEQANRSGMISGPATAISKWAAYLIKVPTIAPFATATSIAADATASIAKIFGFCRPPVTKNPEPYRPTPFSSLAVTNVPDTAQKLTVDEKQELSIDPRIAGLGGVDQLNIREIAKRESYLTKFTWAIGTTPETLLWNARVDPVIWNETAALESYHFPACAFAALPFKYWTGSMKFRFQIVCSSFHKGRLKFVYDPNYFASNEYNTNYLRIVDISEEQDFTIEVGNGQPLTLLEHHYPGVDSVTQMFSTTAYTQREEGNGVIGVYVVNELTVPNSTIDNDIEINVFVSMGDDFEVFVPDDHFQKFIFTPIVEPEPPPEGFVAQSGEIVPESQNTAEPDAPLQSQTNTVGMSESQDGLINKVFTGEAITSFRTMLKRYNLWSALGALDDVEILTYGRFPLFPYWRGYATGAEDATAAGVPYNYCNTVLLHWVKAAYSGWRGSIRYKLIPRGYHVDYDRVDVQRSTWYRDASEYEYTQINQPTYNSLKDVRRGIVHNTDLWGIPTGTTPFSGVLGQALTITNVNGTLEFEAPYYSKYRFTPGKALALTNLMAFDAPGWDYRIEQTGDQTTVYDIHCAAGEDFQVYFFTGLPRCYYEPTPIA